MAAEKIAQHDTKIEFLFKDVEMQQKKIEKIDADVNAIKVSIVKIENRLDDLFETIKGLSFRNIYRWWHIISGVFLFLLLESWSYFLHISPADIDNFFVRILLKLHL